jgi:hypothetical protein
MLRFVFYLKKRLLFTKKRKSAALRTSSLNSIIELTLYDYKALNDFRIAVVKVVHKVNIAPLISRQISSALPQ